MRFGEPTSGYLQSYRFDTVSDVSRKFSNQSFEFFKAVVKRPILARIIRLTSA